MNDKTTIPNPAYANKKHYYMSTAPLSFGMSPVV